jgi:hypothetical protein
VRVRSWKRFDWPAIAFALAASAVIAFSAKSTGDYSAQMEPAVRALAQGDLGRFFDQQPVYGCLSAIVQAPSAAIAVHLAHGGDLLLYQVALLPCLFALGLVGVQLRQIAATRGQQPLVCAAVCVIALVNPATFEAVKNGHPEELLAAALLVGAVLSALRGRRLQAAVLLGLAVSTKQWALLGVLPVLFACGDGWRPRLRMALTAAGIATALTAPMLLTNSERFTTNARAAQGGTVTASRFSVWWPLASERERVVKVGDEESTVVLHRLPSAVSGLARPAIVALALVLVLFHARSRRWQPGEEVLGLLALVLLLRCVLDPLNNSYYHVPILLSLLAWEGSRLAGLPALTLLAAAALWASFSHFLLVHATANNLSYLAWMLALSAWIALSLFAPAFMARARRRLKPLRMALPAGRAWLPVRNV